MASFECPECRSNSLSITCAITLPPDSRSDDIILQTITCRQCKFRGIAVYEESRRGGFDSESWDHRGHRVNKETLAELNKLINACPDKRNHHCDCPSHQAMGRKNEYGRWIPPFQVDWQQSFPMRRI